MKLNKWTIGLAAVGVVSLASVTEAQETANSVLTSLSSTTLSGYVDTSAQWNFGTGNENNPPYSFGGPSKADGFNLNVVQLSLDKPLDESEWAAGYHVDLWMGPDANTLGTQSSGTVSDFAIRQAYVALRTPIGNGIDWKMGVFDTVIGYESMASPNDPNFTRSYGFTIEPTTHTGLLGSYRVSDEVAFSFGIADTVGPMINSRAFPPSGTKAESYKTYLGSIALTAPNDWGWIAGSTLYGGVVNGFSGASGDNTTSWYLGTTLATPVAGLKAGVAWDYLVRHNLPTAVAADGDAWTLGLYTSYQATEKLSLHARGEYLHDRAGAFYDPTGYLGDTGYKVWALTMTAQYDLWKNVMSRLEFRWDHADAGKLFGATAPNGNPSRKNATMLALNIIYQF